MNQMEQLCAKLTSEIPEVITSLDPPSQPSGTWWLDADVGGHKVIVEWRPGRGFGISASPAKAVYGEGPDEVLPDVKSAGKRVVALLRGRKHTQPPREMLLKRLREVRRVSQVELAKELNVSQATVSKIERRSDMYLSTLRKLIAAMGGELEIRAKFPEGIVRISQFHDLNTGQGKNPAERN